MMAILFWIIAAVWGYSLVAYPFVVGLVGWWYARRASGEGEACSPSVSLIIPAHNEERVIREKLENAISLDYPRDCLEILVASDGSTDGTAKIVREFADRGVRLLDFSARRGKASVVNDALAESAGEIVCLCDANVMFRGDALRRLVSSLADPKVGAVTGQVRLRSDQSNFEHGESLYYWIERWVQVGESSMGSLMGVDGGMYALRRQLYEPLRPDTILDDFVISMRVIKQGRRVVYQPGALAEENGTPKAMQEFRRRVRVSAGAVQSLTRGEFPPPWRPVEFAQFVSHKLIRWLGPLFMLTLLSLNLLLWNQSLLYRIALVSQLVVYFTAALAALSLPIRATRFGAVPFYFVMSHLAMVVGYAKGIFGMQSVTWQQADRAQLTNVRNR